MRPTGLQFIKHPLIPCEEDGDEETTDRSLGLYICIIRFFIPESFASSDISDIFRMISTLLVRRWNYNIFRKFSIILSSMCIVRRNCEGFWPLVRHWLRILYFVDFLRTSKGAHDSCLETFIFPFSRDYQLSGPTMPEFLGSIHEWPCQIWDRPVLFLMLKIGPQSNEPYYRLVYSKHNWIFNKP